MQVHEIEDPRPTKLSYSVKSLASACDVSQGEIYARMRAGELIARRWGKRTIIEAAEAERFIKSLPKWAPVDQAAA